MLHMFQFNESLTQENCSTKIACLSYFQIVGGSTVLASDSI